MITKFIRKRNVNTNLPFSRNFARVQVHADGLQTFKFTKRIASSPIPPADSAIITEQDFFLTSELGNRLITG